MWLHLAEFSSTALGLVNKKQLPAESNGSITFDNNGMAIARNVGTAG